MTEQTSSYPLADRRLGRVRIPVENSILPVDVFSIRLLQRRHHVGNTIRGDAHRHTFFEIHTVILGEQIYEIDNKRLNVHAGEFLFIKPYIVHKHLGCTADIMKYGISFSLDDLAEARMHSEPTWLLEAYRNAPPYLISQSNRLINIFNLIFSEAQDAQTGWVDSVRNLVCNLVYEVVRAISPGLQVNIYNECLQESERRMMLIERFIKDNIGVPITNGMVADYIHLSIRQVDRIVREERSVTLRSLIDSIKYEEAKRLLTESSDSIKVISLSLGFADESSFSRFFKRMDGDSPGEYRKERQAL